MPGAFKLDHLLPFKPILFGNFSNFFTFIQGSQFLLPQSQRANNEKGEFSQLLSGFCHKMSLRRRVAQKDIAAYPIYLFLYQIILLQSLQLLTFANYCRVFDEPVGKVRDLGEDGGSDVGVALEVPGHDAAQHAALADQGAPGVAAARKSPLPDSRNLRQNFFGHIVT